MSDPRDSPSPSPLSGRRALVTGAAGFLGRRLAARLAADGAHVWGTSRRDRPQELAVAGWLSGDLAEPGFAERLVTEARPEYVFHLASHVTGSRDLAAVLPTFRGNLASTVHLLAALAAAGGCERVVLAGSLEEPAAEDPEARPPSPYAAAKHGASVYGDLFHRLYDLPVTVARLFMVYGPGQDDTAKLVPYVVLSLLDGESPRLSSGRRGVDWIHVDDVVAGLAAAAHAPGLEGERVDLGSGELVSVAEVAERISGIVAEVLERPSPPLALGALPDRAGEPVRTADRGDRERLGWEPRFDLDSGLADTVAWYREHYRAGS